MTLVQRAERVEPLALQMDKLLPLPSRVTELQTSVTGLQTSLTKSGVRSQPNTSGQLSTSAEQDLPPITFLPQASSPPAPLFPSPDIDASLRPSKKRKLEEAVESIEERLDTMQNEVDNVVWDVAEIEKRVCPSKRARTSKPLSSPESGEITESESSRAQYGHPDLDAWRKKIDGDVDKVVKAVSQLWQGEGDWPERLESGLEVAWAKSLKLRENGDKSTGLAIVRLLNATRKDVDLVKLAVQSQGPGVMASGAGSVDAVMERIVDQMVERMSKHHAKFKSDLEEWLDKSTKPVKDVCRALKTAGGVFE
ncbi:hypothetical protein FS749_002850 [Ceratobasidium sp. UAMH 11750]|nr:hypothetical protein FS749_002850 [Ceratobasidium sp. UAMH 11750]